MTQRSYALDRAGLHRWLPIAPQGRVEVELDHPKLKWSGSAYLDSNAGQQPLESAFARWHWSRAELRNGTAVLYDVCRRDEENLSLALRIDTSGGIEEFPAPPLAALKPSRWGIARATRSDHADAAVTQTLLDAPFYARSIVSSSLLGQKAFAVHESLSLDRFRSGWVQAMLPFRMPRPPA
jgi:carotenoid 1,2-hydratase